MNIFGIIIIEDSKTTPNYVVPTSNFSDGQAYLLGVPCKVLSDHPYKKVRKTILGDVKVEDVIDVEYAVVHLKLARRLDAVPDGSLPCLPRYTRVKVISVGPQYVLTALSRRGGIAPAPCVT